MTSPSKNKKQKHLLHHRLNAFLGFVFVFLFLAPTFAHAQETVHTPETSTLEEASSLCPSYLPPAIQVRQQIKPPLLDHTRSLADIRDFAGSSKESVASGHHEVPVGVTIADLQLSSEYEISLTEIHLPNHSLFYCAIPARFDLTISIADTTVYVAKELPENSCSYLTIQQHEGFHVKTDRDLVYQLTQTLPIYLARSLRELGTVSGDSREDVNQRVKDGVQQFMTNIKKEIIAVRQQRQTAIDSPQEYQRLTLSCDGALRALIMQAQRENR